MCKEFSQCYDDVNICLWTNGSKLTQYDAQAACQQRNNSFLPRITNWKLQYTLQLFRAELNSNNDTSELLETGGFWIDANATVSGSFQWIDGSSFAGFCAVLYLLLSKI